jgi:hypothetical protein
MVSQLCMILRHPGKKVISIVNTVQKKLIILIFIAIMIIAMLYACLTIEVLIALLISPVFLAFLPLLRMRRFCIVQIFSPLVCMRETGQRGMKSI